MISDIKTIKKQKNENVYGDIINGIKQGLDEKAVKEYLSKQTERLISEMKEEGGRITEETTRAVRSLVERKFNEFVCNIRAEQAKSDESIKAAVEANFERLRSDYGLLFKNVVVKFGDLKNLIRETDFKMEIICGRLADFCLNIGGSLSKFINTYEIELRQGELSLRSGDFAHADAYFDKATQNNDTKAAAYFGKALAEWQVQLIWDSVENSVQPILYKYNIDLSEDGGSYYATALRFATAEQKRIFKGFAEKLWKLREIFEDYQNRKIEYDCFICAKETGAEGEDTDDCDWIQTSSLYQAMEKRALVKPFFAKFDCKKYRAKKGSLAYNALIYYALSKAKVMLLVCSDESYLQTPWVKNEINRFRAFLEKRHESLGRIMVVFKGTPIELEDEFGRRFQGHNRAECSVDEIVHDVETAVADAKRFTEDNYKYCPQCGHRYALDERWCSRCEDRPELVDALTMSNLTRAKEEEDHKRKYEKAKQENEELKRKYKENERETEELKRRKEEAERENEQLKRELKAQSHASSEDSATFSISLPPKSSRELKREVADRKRFEKYQRKAQKGNVIAYYGLGLCYKNGRGVPCNEKTAVEWFQKAAEQGFPPAQYELGKYYDGEEDYKTAGCWYRKAAEQGHGSAQYELAIYERALNDCEKVPGVFRDFGDAIKWCRMAVSNPLFSQLRSINNMFKAVECEKEWGIEISPETIKWYREAAKRGSEKARADLADLGEKVLPIIVHKSWWPLTIFLGLCSVTLVVLYWLECYYLNLGSATSIVFTVLFAIACLAFVAWSIVGAFCNDWWGDGHIFRYPVLIHDPVVPASRWAKNSYSILLFGCDVGCVFVGCYAINLIIAGAAIWRIILVFIGLAPMLLEIFICSGTWNLGRRWWCGLANYLVLVLFTMSLGFGWTTLEHHSAYGNVTTIENYHYIINEDDTLSFLLDNYGEEEVVIPSECNGKSVTGIESTHEEYPALKNIIIPESVTSIGLGLFKGCSSLESVTVPYLGWGDESYVNDVNGNREYDSDGNPICINNVTAFIDYFSWYESKSEEKYIKIESSRKGTYINGNQAGMNSYSSTTRFVPMSLRSVTVLGGNLPYGAFNGFSMLSEIIIPNGALSIGEYAFHGCTSLASIVIPKSVTEIGYDAFAGCNSLTNIIIPDSVTKIGYNAFLGCSELTIYCEANQKPVGWAYTWNPDNCAVQWNYGKED